MNAIHSPPINSQLVRTLLAGEFALTAEIVPPVSSSRDHLLAICTPLKGRVDAVNVTDGPGAKVHMSALAAGAIMAANGVEPVLQITCRDRNRIALLSDLLGASALGIQNLLILRGDDPEAGSYPEATPVFDADSLDLINWASTLADKGALPASRCLITNEGVSPTTSPVKPKPKFFIGAADTPLDPPIGWRPEGLERKIQAGAQFVQTQLSYNIGLVREYMKRLTDLGVTDRVFMLIGTGPIASARSARWMNKNLWGVTVPEDLIDRLDRAENPKAEGMKLCMDFLAQLTDLSGVAGAHLMAPGNGSALPELIDGLQISRRATQSA